MVHQVISFYLIKIFQSVMNCLLQSRFKKKTEPHFMLGLKDNINYTSDFKWQLSFYPW